MNAFTRPSVVAVGALLVVMGIGVRPVEAEPAIPNTLKEAARQQASLAQETRSAGDMVWPSGVRLGEAPQCLQVLTEQVRRAHLNPTYDGQPPGPCDDLALDASLSPRERLWMCVRAYCCDEPSDDYLTCQGPRDRAIVACADALIARDEGAIDRFCMATKPVRTTTRVATSLALPSNSGGPKVEFGDAFTNETPPLAKAIKDKVKKRRKKEKKEIEAKGNRKTPKEEKCLAALDWPDYLCDGGDNAGLACDPGQGDVGCPNGGVCAPHPDKEHEIKKNCKNTPRMGPQRDSAVPTPGPPAKKDIMVGGKKRGKQIKTKTVLHFSNAAQRYGHDKKTRWDRVILKPPQTGDLTAKRFRERAAGGTNTKDKTRKRTLLSADTQAINDDRDCIDTVTREHLGGVGVLDGAPDSCFDATGRLRMTLEELPGFGCRHIETGTVLEGAIDCIGCEDANGTFIPADPDDGTEDDCFDANGIPKSDMTPIGTDDDCYNAHNQLKTTLVELFDEDPQSTDADGDGLSGEDGPDRGDGVEPINNDRDCVDLLTGEHKGGPMIADGSPESCFDGNGEIKRTLSVAYIGCESGAGEILDGDPYDGVEDDCYLANGDPKVGMSPIPNGCVHANGTFLEGDTDTNYGCEDEDGNVLPGDPDDGVADDCYDAAGNAMPGVTPLFTDDACYDIHNELKTTLAELIDEDDGEPVDDDEDGEFDEDPPEAPVDFTEACKQIGRDAGLTQNLDDMITDDGGCDLTRVVIRKANDKAKNSPHSDKVFLADDEGYPTADVAANQTAEADASNAPPRWEPVPYGDEERVVEIEESFTVMCDPGMVLDDGPSGSGQCVDEGQAAALAVFRAAQAFHAGSGAAGASVTDEVMMGFTFAPPRIRWGLFYKEELDLWLFTITLFEVKAGVDFHLGAGFRLPAEVTVSGLPGPPGVLAEDQLDLETYIMPADFTAQDYRNFCAQNQMGNTAYCNRFAFPNALVPEDGDEFALRLGAFAGLKVVIIEIPIVNWGIDVDYDVPEMLSYYFALNEEPDKLATEIILQGGNFGKAVTALGLNAGTYTTPFGYDEEGDPLQFPFVANAPIVNQMVRADCAEAFVRGETIKLPDGVVVPICTGLILGVPGASLGMGLGTDLEIRSNLIEAEVTMSQDATFDPSDPFNNAKNTEPLDYEESNGQGSIIVPIDTMTADNYDDIDNAAHDDAVISLGDFTYCLNTFSLRLKGQIMFGGVLTIFPDFDDFTVYRFTIPGTGCGIPIGQHANTKDVRIPVFVENYGLTVDATTADLKPVKPGCALEGPDSACADHDFTVHSIGSVSDDFDNFQYELSNRRRINSPPDCPYEFSIKANNDHDCTVGGVWYRGDPFDGVADACYDECGHVQPGAVELIDEDPEGCLDPNAACRSFAEKDDDLDGIEGEDPPDADIPWQARWASEPDEPGIAGVAPHSTSQDTVGLRVRPYPHFMTGIGVYQFRVKADSVGAKTCKAGGLAAHDPRGNYRMEAPEIVAIEVIAFFDPKINAIPDVAAMEPGNGQQYVVEGKNGSNVPDSIDVATTYVDFNQAGCDLITLGKDPDCPYRAVPTVVPADWRTGEPPGHFPATLPPPCQPPDNEPESLIPGCYDAGDFQVDVPHDWAGMEDTNYRIELDATSVKSVLDPIEPTVTNSSAIEHTVIATFESRTRFIKLEIETLIERIEAANAEGVRTGGLLPIAVHPMQMTNQRALDLVLEGRTNNAISAHSANIHQTEAFIRALEGFSGHGTKIPEEYYLNWKARAEAIIEDLHTTIELAEASEQAGRAQTGAAAKMTAGQSLGGPIGQNVAEQPR